MTREEYAKRMKKHPDWAPGWDAIDAAFAKLYPEAEPVRFESELHDRAALGGEDISTALPSTTRARAISTSSPTV